MAHFADILRSVLPQKVDLRTREGRKVKTQAKRCADYINEHWPEQHRAAIAEYRALRAMEADAIRLTVKTP